MKIVLGHGFNDPSKGANNVDLLEPSLQHHFPQAQIDKDGADYGHHGLLKVRFFNKDAVKRMSDAISDADVFVGHSNGCNYCMKALKLLKAENRENPRLHIAFISPALNRKQPLEDYQFKRMVVYYSTADKIVWLSKLLLNHPWGNAGQKGLITNDKRYIARPHARVTHSGWFNDLAVVHMGGLIASDYNARFIFNKYSQ